MQLGRRQKRSTLFNGIRMTWIVWIAGLAIYLPCGIRASGQSPSQISSSTGLTAYVGAKVFPSPTDAAIEDATVLVKDGRISTVGPRLKIKVPSQAHVVHCEGLVIVAGMWNSHVHFYTPEWLNAATAPADRLSQQLTATYLRYGFVHVVDLGSFLSNTLALRNRINAGEVAGPAILTAGEPLYPAGGVPEVAKQFHLPEAATPEQATEWAQRQLANGADVLKLFTGAGYSGPITIMPADLVRAVVVVAHSHNKLVFAHTQTVVGRQAAVAGGVDVLAHTPDPSGDDNASMLQTLKAHGTVVIPTLKLWADDVDPSQKERVVNNGVNEVRAFNAIGGTIIFGTDVGYVPDVDPTDEYRLMSRAGMTFSQILASLTINPAHLFGVADRTGRVASGFDADLVFLGGDPSVDITAFANVKSALLRGRILFDLSTNSNQSSGLSKN